MEQIIIFKARIFCRRRRPTSFHLKIINFSCWVLLLSFSVPFVAHYIECFFRTFYFSFLYVWILSLMGSRFKWG